MPAQAIRILAGMLLLMLLPLAVMLSNWHWQPNGYPAWLLPLFWLTETVTQPFGIFTHCLLCGWFLWCLRFRLKSAVLLLLLLGCAVLAGQGIKSVIKEHVQEPRPYVVWLEQQHQVPVEQFYSLPRHQRAALVAQQLRDSPELPSWLRKHWEKETGFAFPSGHTMFAASWALLAIGLLWPRGHRITVILVTAWSVGVMASRLALGMHWPQDLLMATGISAGIVLVACWLTQLWCRGQPVQENP